MKHRDYDGPEFFQECVSTIALKGRPQGLLDEWLADSDVDIIIDPGKKKSVRGAQPWLDLSELEELHWANKISDAHIQSDHFESSHCLYLLSNIKRLTFVVLGRSFDAGDLENFHLAVLNLTKLTQLHIIVTSDALEPVRDCLFWPGANFTVEITSNSQSKKRRQKNYEPQPKLS